MRKFSLRGGGDYIRLGIEELARMKISMLAANTGYFIVLSVFPALLLLLSGLRYTGLSVDDLLEALNGVIPQAMMGTARGLILSVYNNASGTVAGVSALTALWSSSRGMYGLLTGLNTIYGVAEDRGYLYTRSISVLYTFLFVIVLLLTLLLHVFGGTLMKFVRQLNLPGMTVLLVEQNALATLEIADRGYVIEVGQNVMNGDSKWLLDNEDMKKAYLGI